MNKLLENANQITTDCSLLSNIYRTLIIMYLMDKGKSTWSEIKQFIESNSGSINPNTLHFHLKALIDSKFIKMQQLGIEKNVYALDNLPQSISDIIRSKK